MKRIKNNVIGMIRLYYALARLKTPESLSALADAWPKNKWILGHRGARDMAAENIISSFKLAMEHGADGVEFDVQLSADGVPVVIHDHAVDRTTDQRGLVKDMSAQELAKLDATKTFKNSSLEGIPSLEQTIAALPNSAIANVELKGSGNYSKREYIDRVLKVLKPHQGRVKIIVSSFDGQVLSMLRKADPSFLIAALFSTRDDNWPSSINYLPNICPSALHLPKGLANIFIRWLIRKKGLHLAIWTLNSPKEATKWFARGADGIFTDKVKLMCGAIIDR